MIGPKDVQAWVTGLRDKAYAPHSIHHYQEVLRVVMNEAVTWYNLEKNPALGVRLPKLEVKRKTFALTPEQAGQLISSIPQLKIKTMIALAIVTSLRRGELLSPRRGLVAGPAADPEDHETVLQGRPASPKKEAGKRG